MAAYKNQLNTYQLNTLNLIDNFDIRKSLMSILSYMFTINDCKNEDYQEYQLDFLEKDPNELKISFAKLHDLYIKGHQSISLKTMKNRIEMLIDLKLLTVVRRAKKTNVYRFIFEKIAEVEGNTAKEVPNEVPENLPNNEMFTSIEILA